MSSRHFWFPFLLIVMACGSSAKKPAESGADENTETSSSSPEAKQSTEDVGDEAAPARPKCDDGTCMDCGDGICPTGYYCDEGAKPAVCAWIPACATDASCACLGRALSGCKCESRGSGSYVTCSE